jgi:hypothetical protein
LTRRSPNPSPPIDAIVAANEALLARLGIPLGMAHTSCWACGIGCKTPTRAHVVAKTLGGSNEPDNFFLLCDHCHGEQPDGAPREAQERWLRDAPSWGEWSAKIADEAYGAVRAAAAKNGHPPELVSQWFGGLSFDELDAVVSGGYRGAAGLENGRHNVASRLIDTFLEWAANAPAKEVAC